MGEINMTPLVDVMLVLLIVFIITVPVINHVVPVKLPQASSAQAEAEPDTVHLSVDAEGIYFWNEIPLADDALDERLAQASGQQPQPQIHIRGDARVPYERIALLIAALHRAGLGKIGFVSEPRP
ncbi:MAG: biopolymer transporter ExbD [Candidatus Accumulibacter sp.]|nr:biopolymer transporter ExbD [Accumulibacter sp.]